MLGDVSSATTQHLFRCIFSTPEAILVVVNQKDAADSIGFVQSIHLEMPQMVLWHGQRPPKTTHTVILFWFFQSRIFSIPTTLGDGSTKLKWDFQIPSSDNWFPQQENTILSLGFQGVLSESATKFWKLHQIWSFLTSTSLSPFTRLVKDQTYISEICAWWVSFQFVVKLWESMEEYTRGWQSRCIIVYPFTKLDTHGNMSKNRFLNTHIEDTHLFYA